MLDHLAVGSVYACSDCYVYRRAAHCDSGCGHTNSHSNTGANRHANANGNTHTNGNTDTDGNANANGNTDTHSNINALTIGHRVTATWPSGEASANG